MAWSGQVQDKKTEHLQKLVAALNNVPVTGASIGPYTGISDNDSTRAVVHEGRDIVPFLVSALDHSSWSQSVWIVFCLRELRAVSAKDRVLQLKKELENGTRFSSEAHNFTLNVQIRAYLADLSKSESAPTGDPGKSPS